MKHSYKPLIMASLLAALGLGAGAQTTPSDPAQTGIHGHRFDPAKMQERMARRQAALKAKLQITPAQEGAWNAWIAALAPGNFTRPDRTEFDQLTTPERIDRMRALRAQRFAEMDRRGDATKTFYASLSPGQQAIFDDQTARGHRRWHDRQG
jgi:periplasmic protein CpxP/Spy